MSQVLFSKKVLAVSLVGSVLLVASFSTMTACTQNAKAKINFVHKDAPKQGVVAKIGNEEITEEMLVGDDKLDFFDLKKREYDLRMSRLEKLLIDKLVGAEAKKANLSLDEFINKKVLSGGIKVSDEKLKKFVADKHIPENQASNPQIKERIIAYIQAGERQEMVEQYLAKLTKSSPVEVYFNKPKLVEQVDAGNAPFFGKKDAKVTIVEFSDFQCPYCAKGAEIVGQLKKKYGSKIKFAFRQLPLPMHPNAKPAAEASMCVSEQNPDKFWTYHDLLFKNQDKLDAANLAKFAKEVGADAKKFDECVKSKKYAEYVQKDMEYGEKLGVKSTPTFFINGQLLNGAVPLENFSEVIDEELGEK